MEFNKCSQCGSFFASTGKLCPNCTTIDNNKIQKLANYLEDYSMPNSLNQLSYDTGISVKDLSRYIQENDKFAGLCSNGEVSHRDNIV